jgi:hypothetical protein
MSIYKWAMRHASVILFVISAAIVLIGFGQALLGIGGSGGETSIGGEPVSAKLVSLLVFFTGVFTALVSAAIPFIGAVVIHRWDRRMSQQFGQS